jgi:hypothetical protein
VSDGTGKGMQYLGWLVITLLLTIIVGDALANI